jgi:hypothetical protein
MSSVHLLERINLALAVRDCYASGGRAAAGLRQDRPSEKTQHDAGSATDGSGRALCTNPSQVEVPLFAAKSNAFAMHAHLMFATAVPPG